MNTEKIIRFIDKSASGKESYKKIILKELSSNKDDLISFLVNIDKFHFMYVLQLLDEILLNVYSEDFMKEFKEKVFAKYNILSNINIKSHETGYGEHND